MELIGSVQEPDFPGVAAYEGVACAAILKEGEEVEEDLLELQEVIEEPNDTEVLATQQDDEGGRFVYILAAEVGSDPYHITQLLK